MSRGAAKKFQHGRMAAASEKDKEAEGRKRQRRDRKGEAEDESGRVWVSFHEGFSNAVRKPITLAELMKGL